MRARKSMHWKTKRFLIGSAIGLCLVLGLAWGVSRFLTPYNDLTGEVESLGTPYREQYLLRSKEDVSLVPWDMKLADGKLYVGAGDYDENTGPVPLSWYDTQTGEWTLDGYTVEEEAVVRFLTVDGQLTIPGTDAREGWEAANYYQLEDGQWVKHRVLPEARHCFDLLEYDGRLFAAVGATPGSSPILISSDGGATFTNVPLCAQGDVIDTTNHTLVRCYYLFAQNGGLFGLVLLDGEQQSQHCIVRYNQAAQAFDVVGEADSSLLSGTAVGYRIAPFCSTVEWRGINWFTNGTLKRFNGANYIEDAGLLEDFVVWDLLVYDDALYALTCCEDPQGGKQVVVQKTTDGENFTQVLRFSAQKNPLSFETDGESFYIGMVNLVAPTVAGSGEILRIPWPARGA